MERIGHVVDLSHLRHVGNVRACARMSTVAQCMTHPGPSDPGQRDDRVDDVASRAQVPATPAQTRMHRRQVVRYLGAALALPFLPKSAAAAIQLGEELHLRLREEEVPFRTLNARQQALVTELADLIIPKTDTPSATDVKVPEFVDLIATEWMSDDERAAFLAGLNEIDAKGFANLSRDQKTALVATLDKARNDTSGAGHAFGRIKALTVYGYFTSAPIQRDVLKTQVMFDGYHGDVPFTPAT